MDKTKSGSAVKSSSMTWMSNRRFTLRAEKNDYRKSLRKKKKKMKKA